MTKVLLTGGSGFIAAHILEQLLEKKHKVVTTVRSEDKAKRIRAAHPELGKDDLDIVIVPDIAKPGAFDDVVKIPGLEVVLHSASPFHFKFSDPLTELIHPALNGTEGILKAVARSAPTVKRVVVTSSFASILDEAHIKDPNTIFTEESWNPVTIDDIYKNPGTAYRASKKLAEKAAWDFVKDPANGAKFDIVTVCPPLVFGPVVHHLASLESINTSNERVVGLVTGKWKDANAIPDTAPAFSWVDVRDVARAHIRAFELPEAGGHRLWATEGYFCNRDLYDIVSKKFPDLKAKLPPATVEGGKMAPADQVYKFDNSATTKLLGIKWLPLETSIVDTVNSLKPFLKE